MEQENIIKLADYLRNSEAIPTAQTEESEVFPLSKDKIAFRRSFSFFCDFFVVMMLKTAASVSYAAAMTDYMPFFNANQKLALATPHMGFELAIFLTIFFCYFFYCSYVLEGKTMGSFLMKLSVVDDAYPFTRGQAQSAPTMLQAFKRSIGYMACYLSFGTFFFFPLLNQEKKGVPDFLSGTRVVSDEWLSAFKAYNRFDREEARININSLDIAA